MKDDKKKAIKFEKKFISSGDHVKLGAYYWIQKDFYSNIKDLISKFDAVKLYEEFVTEIKYLKAEGLV